MRLAGGSTASLRICQHLPARRRRAVIFYRGISPHIVGGGYCGYRGGLLFIAGPWRQPWASPWLQQHLSGCPPWLGIARNLPQWLVAGWLHMGSIRPCTSIHVTCDACAGKANAIELFETGRGSRRSMETGKQLGTGIPL